MNHLDDLEPRSGPSWSTITFMLGEIQYGGRITDDFDQRLLKAFCECWFSEVGGISRIYFGFGTTT